MRYNWLIVGAGFTGGILAERLASQLSQNVLLIDKRTHIGGNAYDEPDEHGILVHKYGPHIFHTNDEKVWNYLSEFTEWLAYEHRVMAVIDDRFVPVPFNLNSLETVFPAAYAERLERALVRAYGIDANVPILRMREHPDPEIRSLSDYVYSNVFENYTLKQWGLRPEELAPTVTGRVPVRIGRDDRYFQDTYQAMPKNGFTPMFRRILAHSNITLELGCDFGDLGTDIEYDRMVYTGPIDAFFDYIHGELPYRSLRFEFEHMECEWLQPVATINYPNSEAYTRITEFKRLTGQRANSTSIVREYPQAYIPGENDPYYPVPLSNRDLYARYESEAQKLGGRVLFAGRLGDYKYYNMDQAVGRALQLFREIAQGKP